ncbi:MAG: hypothetical protein L3J67_08020 [Hyphomicrobiaceae bacterium]|nr:hypothetical protein [Hyphomicrobiaceae bacterium]
MSLNRLALRIATVLALKGRTHAGEAVFDSRNVTIDELVRDEAVPVISVYTDEDMPGDERQVNLVIECAVSVLEQRDGKEPQLWTPTTDPMLELNLDLLEAEIMDVLREPDNEAADIWRTLAFDIVKTSSQRGVFGVETDQRLAARQLLLSVRLLADTQGETIVAIDRLFGLMERDDYYAAAVPQLRDFANRNTGRHRADVDAARLMIPQSSFKALRVVYGVAGGA